MKFTILFALAMVALSSSAERVKGRRSSVFNLPANAKVRAEDVEQYLRIQSDYEDADVEPVAGELRQAGAVEAQAANLPVDGLKADSSNGRMFLKKFLLFSNMFGNSNTQPIIPIIITGTGTTSGTSSVTTTGTISGTGTITTSPQSRAGGIETDDYLIGEEDIIDDQIGNGKANANRQKIIKYKQAKGNNQQGLGFVVPPNYVRYFQNNPNTIVVNPATFNNGANKLRKLRLNNNGNVKRKRSRSTPVRRFVPQQ